MFITLCIGTAGFTFIAGYPPFDALYMALTTITTVGYGEIHPLSRTARMFNACLIFIGVGVMYLGFGAITQTIIELEFGEYFGKRRTRRMIDKLTGHVIVCGFGRVGRSAASELQREGATFVVVDRSEDRAETARRQGMLVLVADASRDETLREARIERARGLICALSSDADNLFVILSARSLNPKLFLAARAAEDEAEDKMRRAGANVIFTPYSSAGHHLAQVMVRPHVHQFLDFTTKNIGLDVTIEQVQVSPASRFVGRSLRDGQLRRDFGVIVLAIRRADGKMDFNPAADAVIAANDHLIVMGEQAKLRQLESLLNPV